MNFIQETENSPSKATTQGANGATMKAAVYTQYGPARVVKIMEVAKPAPKDSEVLIKIHAAAVGATDPVYRSGRPLIARGSSGLFSPKHPILGDVLAGVIEAVGKDVSKFKIGDQVYGSSCDNMGGHAQYICLCENSGLAIKPRNISFGQAAAVCDGASISLTFLRDKANIQSNHKVLINGASGSLGTFAVQLAKYYGAQVTAVCSSANVDMVKSIGADHVIDYTKEDFTKNGKTYDIIYDTVAKRSYLQCRGSLTKTGKYLSTFPTVPLLVQMLWTSKGSGKKAVFVPAGLKPKQDKAKDLDFLRQLIEDGKLTSVIERDYPLEHIVDAHRHVEKGHKKGNVVISI